MTAGRGGAARAQSPERPRRIGFLMPPPASTAAEFVAAFRQGLRDLGYSEGRDIVIDFRFAEGRLDRLPALAAELVQTNPEVIVCASSVTTLAVRKATSTIPIVMTNDSLDPVESGLAASYARPGGTVTGLVDLAADLPVKLLELTREVLPRAERVALLVSVNNPLHVAQWRQIEAAGLAGDGLLRVEVRTPADIDGAFATLVRARADAVVVPGDALLYSQRVAIAAQANAARLPSICGVRGHAVAGSLMSYGVVIPENFHRAAFYVDRILRGDSPGNLPIEQPRKFELVVNVKTAKALGIEIPTPLLLRANEVIE
jgi:putative ABC transport system substrate-binding protein